MDLSMINYYYSKQKIRLVSRKPLQQGIGNVHSKMHFWSSVSKRGTQRAVNLRMPNSSVNIWQIRSFDMFRASAISLILIRWSFRTIWRTFSMSSVAVAVIGGGKWWARVLVNSVQLGFNLRRCILPFKCKNLNHGTIFDFFHFYKNTNIDWYNWLLNNSWVSKVTIFFWYFQCIYTRAM